MFLDKVVRFYTVEQLGAKQALTPEGFLLCLDVPIARTGTMIYGPGESEIPVGPDGLTHIERNPDQVFRPETIASFNGKPVVNDHPEHGVTPANWNELAVGTVMNPRREGDLMIADLLITNPQAIFDIQEGKREVSCGYDTDYEETGPGRGVQTNIVGNHVALVERGRCGARCSIKDHAAKNLPQGDKPVAKKTWDQAWQGIKDKLNTAFKTQDKAEFTAALDSIKVTKDDGEQVHVHFPEEKPESYTKDDIDNLIAGQNAKHTASDARHTAHDSDIAGLNTKCDKMAADMAPLLPGQAAATAATAADEEPMSEKELENEAPAGTGDKAVKAKDSAYMEDSFTSTVAAAEIIAPGIKLPTFDRAIKPMDSFKQVCNLRRQALTMGLNDSATNSIIQEARGGRTLDAAGVKAMDCGAVRGLFFGVAAAKKRANNTGAAVRDSGRAVTKTTTLADLNKKHSEHYTR